MPKKNAVKKDSHISQINEFYSDISNEGMLFAALIRSPSVGRIAKIKVPDMPDGFFFFSAKDIPGKKEIVTNKISTPIFAEKKSNYIGEPLGIIIGPNEKHISHLMSQFEIQFDETATLEALENFASPLPITENSGNDAEIDEITKALQITQDANASNNSNTSVKQEKATIDQTDNIVASRVFSIQNETNSDGDKTFEEIKTTTKIQPIEQNWIEPSGALCTIHDGNITVYTQTKNPSALRYAVANALGISENQVFIKKTKESSSSTDGLWRTTMIVAQTAVAAYKAQKNVRLILSRTEQKQFMVNSEKVSITHESKVDQSGKINSMKITLDADIGAQNPFAQILLDRLVIASCNIYCPENISIEAKAYTTSTPPTSISARMIDMQSFFAIENHFSQIAKKLNLLPEEIVQANISDDKKTIMPFSFKLKNPISTYQKLLAISGFNRKYVSFKNETQNKQIENRVFQTIPFRGIGIASAFEGTDYLHPDFFVDNQKVEVTLEADGSASINSHIPIPAIKTLWMNIIEKEFGIPKSRIKFEIPEKNINTSKNSLEMAHESIGVLTELFEKCCSDLKKKNIQKKQLPITSKKTLSSSIKKQWDSKELRGSPFYTMSFATTAIELQIDPYTYKVTIKGIWIVIDCGKIISVPAAERSLRLAIQQELSNLIADEILPCEQISISFVQSSERAGLLSNIIHNTMPAAFCTALSQALGKNISTLPYTV